MRRPVITRGGDRRRVKEDEFEHRVIEIVRVTRVQAGGKRMRFRACSVVGDQKGKVGMGIGKGSDVAQAVRKATSQAKKHLVEIKIVNGTIPYAVLEKCGSAKILLKPAPVGKGLIAGGPLRMVLEVVGIKNITSKILGSKNKISNVRAVLRALAKLKTREEIFSERHP